MRTLACALLAAACLLAAPAASALSCSVSAQALGFSGYNPLSASNTDAVGDVAVNCTNLLSLLVTYNVSLSAGTNGTFAARKMASGANRINYNLYTDPTRLIVWGDGTAGTVKVGNTFLVVLLGITAHHTVYGRIPALQNVGVGSYTDTITVTLEF
jgi:spore coat protein U-like protein